jgi:hypothetical protein
VSIAARAFLLIFGVLYTAWSLWLILLWRRTLFYPDDPALSASARRYRFRVYALWTAKVGTGLFFLCFGIFAPLSKKVIILLFLPVVVYFLFAVSAALTWRKDYRRLREAGLLKYRSSSFSRRHVVFIPNAGSLSSPPSLGSLYK